MAGNGPVPPMQPTPPVQPIAPNPTPVQPNPQMQQASQEGAERQPFLTPGRERRHCLEAQAAELT